MENFYCLHWNLPDLQIYILTAKMKIQQCLQVVETVSSFTRANVVKQKSFRTSE